MGLYKKHVPDRGLTWEEAVPEALCFGWIDSVAQRIDEDAVRQRWTPRKAAAPGASVNIAHVERLTAEGRMHGPAGSRRTSGGGRSAPASTPTSPATSPCPASRPLGWPPTYGRPRSGTRPPGPTAGSPCSWVLTAKREETRERRMAPAGRGLRRGAPHLLAARYRRPRPRGPRAPPRPPGRRQSACADGRAPALTASARAPGRPCRPGGLSFARSGSRPGARCRWRRRPTTRRRRTR